MKETAYASDRNRNRFSTGVIHSHTDQQVIIRCEIISSDDFEAASFSCCTQGTIPLEMFLGLVISRMEGCFQYVSSENQNCELVITYIHLSRL